MWEVSVTTGPATGRFGSRGAARALADAGFEGVDYQGACSSYRPFEGLYTQPDAAFFGFFEAERQIYADAGLRIVQMHCPYNPPPDRVSEEELVFFVAAVKRAIRAAAVLGAPVAVVHPVIPPDWQQDTQKPYQITDRLCQEYLELGQQVGVQVALENMPGGDTTVPYSCAEQFERLFAKLPGLTACLDTGHANWALPTGQLPAMARALGPRLRCLHLHDNGGTWDNHFLPFGGTVDWLALCQALEESGYTGPVSLETCAMKQMSDALFCQCLTLQKSIAAELREHIRNAYEKRANAAEA